MVWSEKCIRNLFAKFLKIPFTSNIKCHINAWHIQRIFIKKKNIYIYIINGKTI